MSFRQVRFSRVPRLRIRGRRAGDVRDVTQFAQQFAGNPVAAVINFLGSQFLGGLLGEDENARSIRLFNERMVKYDKLKYRPAAQRSIARFLRRQGRRRFA